MNRRPLGRSGLDIAPLMLGGNVFGWTADQATSFEILDAFVGAGCNAIDTADVYSVWVSGHQGGESETIIGRWLTQRGRRDDVVIATKCGGEIAPGRRGLAGRYIEQAVEDSLRRLKTDYIDLYQSHYPDPDTPIEETLAAHGRLIAQGKVRAIGASNYTSIGLRVALDAANGTTRPRYECLQPHYNLCERATYERDLEPVVIQHGMGVIPYFALASGFLTGKYRSKTDLAASARGASATKYLSERGLRILAALDDVAARHAATPAQVALAWLMARPSVTAPIASATSRVQVDELIKATALVLDVDDMAQLDGTGPA